MGVCDTGEKPPDAIFCIDCTHRSNVNQVDILCLLTNYRAPVMA